MTQDNAPDNSPLDERPPAEAGSPKGSGKRRKWLKILGALLILLVLLVLFLPTIASMGFVRSIVVGKINQGLDGRVELDDWSLGWFGRIKLRGVRLIDPKGEKVASIDEISTQLSLMDVIRGNYSFGKTNIDGCEFSVKLDENGEANVAKVPKKHAAKAPKEAAPLELPQLSGDFTIHAKGQIERPGVPVAHINSATISAQIPNLNDPITQDAQIETSLGEGETGTITIHSKVPLRAIENIANKKAPGATGTIDITSTLPNLQALVTQLVSDVSLLPDVQITGGEFKQATHVDVREKDLAISNQLTLSAEGKRAGQPIKLDKVQVTKADATFDPTKDSLAALGNLSLDIQSPFLTVQGGGSPTSGLNIPGTFDLDKLHDQLSQFFDLSKIKLAGTGKFNITSKGDVSAANLPIKTSVTVDIQNLALALPDKEAIQIATLALNSDATVNLTSKLIENSQITLQTGDGQKQIIDCNINASGVDPDSQNVKHFDTKVNVMDLAAAQHQLDALISALSEQGLKITAGALYTNVSGSIDGKTRTVKIDAGNPLELSTPGLSIQKVDDDGKTTDVLKDEKITASIMGDLSMPNEGPMSADIKTLAINTQHKLFSIKKNEGADLSFRMDDNSVGGAGSLLVSADIKAIKDIANHFGGDVQVQTGAGQLTSGQLDATLTISNPKPQTIVQLDGKISNISVTTADPKNPIANETVKIFVKASGSSEASGGSGGKLTTDASVHSAFANLDVKQAELSLKEKELEKAQLLLTAPDLAKLNAVAIAFMPPPAAPTTAPVQKSSRKKSKAAPPPPPPSPPILVTAGSGTLTLNIARDASAGASVVGGLGGDGLLTIPSATVSGMEIGNLLIPITMEKGVASTLYKDKTAAKPATCNGGTLDFSNITCDLTKDTPRLTILNVGKGRRLVQNVSINPVLGDSLGKFVNPVFANSKQAKGLLDVTVTNCQNLALGDKLYTADSGNLRVVFSLSEMDIANPMGSLLIGGILQQLKIPSPPNNEADVFRGQIKDAVVSVEKGVANTDITLSLVDPGAGDAQTSSKKKVAREPANMPLHFWGDIRLADLTQSLNATIPPQLIGKFVTGLGFAQIKDPSAQLATIFPNGIPVVVKGTTTDPKFDFGDVGKQFLAGFGKIKPEDAIKQGVDLLNQLKGKGK